MVFEQIRIGGNRNFAYLIAPEAGGEAAAVDVGYHPERIIERLEALDLKLRWILATHSHSDHVDAVEALREQTDARFAAFKTVSGIDRPLADGERLELGPVQIRMIHCPGHSADSLAMLVDGTRCLTGDELFVGKIGGTATEAMAAEQYRSLHDKLLTLDDSVEVYPGHDFGTSPSSTIGRERRTNPFLLQESFEDFWHLKRNWAQYKKEHGIA